MRVRQTSAQPRQGRREDQQAARRRGFTLLEVSLAVTVLVVAVLAMSASTVRMHTLRRQNRERTVAQNAVRTIGEQIHAISNRELIVSANTWSTNVVAAVGGGGELGNAFPVPELNLQTDDAAVGSIQIITDETARDDALGFDLGMPRDLNGDGDAGDVNVSATARILPVIVRARWNGVGGDQQIAHTFYVIGY